jgi:hypothetical protein
MLVYVALAACGWTFARGYRSVFIQTLAATFGALVALPLPIQHVRVSNGLVRLWLMTFSILAISAGLVLLPNFLVPTLDAQLRLRKILAVSILVVVIGSFIWG